MHRALQGVGMREFPLNTARGFTDHLLYIDGKAAGVIEVEVEANLKRANRLRKSTLAATFGN